MVFKGSIPAELKFLISEITDNWDSGLVNVGFSGNFTIERVLSQKNRFQFYGNDVTIFSCAIGRYYAGQDLNISLRDEFRGSYGFIEKHLKTREGALATILLCSKMLQFGHISNSESKLKNRYYDRLQKGYCNNWDDLISKTSAKITSADFILQNFESGDVVDWCDSLPTDSQFISFPPFFSGDYNEQFKSVADIFHWDEPDYSEFNDERKVKMIEKVQTFRHWLIGSHIKQPELKDNLKGLVRATNRGASIYIYGNTDSDTKLVSPFQKTEPMGIPPMMEYDEIGDDVKVFKITLEQFYGLRSQYMNHNIVVGQASNAWLVVSNNKIVGCFAILSEMSRSVPALLPSPTVYLLSDFAVNTSQYKKLSKLVLIALLSKETKLMMQDIFSQRIMSTMTTAFAENSTSMKYRGLFSLLSRKETTRDQTGKYQLQYGASLGQWDLKEGLALWKKNYL